MPESLMTKFLSKLSSRGLVEADSEEREPDEEVLDTMMVGLRDDVSAGWLDQSEKALAPGFEISAGDVVVDVGCGNAGHAHFCAKMGARVIVADLALDVVGSAISYVPPPGGERMLGMVADGSALPIADQTASHVVCTEVLEHVEDPARVIGELNRIGRPGAQYLISVPTQCSEKFQEPFAPPAYFQPPNHVRVFEEATLLALIEGGGLRVKSLHRQGFYSALRILFTWISGAPLGDGSHPLLRAWARTWNELLDTKDGDRARQAFDELLPRRVAIVADKPQIE